MIVLNNKEPAKEATMMEEKHNFMNMFHREVDAYCGYKEWCESVSDVFLKAAIYEIMEDEYLHARFLRNYMKDNDMYQVEANDPYEKKFLNIEEQLFY